MPRQAFFPDPRSKPIGFSPSTRSGNLVFVSGQVAAGVGGTLVGKGDCGAQTEQCFKNIAAALRAAGASMDDVTKITCFLVNADDYPAYAAARQRVFPEDGPASSTVIIKALVSPDFLVEIEATAAVS